MIQSQVQPPKRSRVEDPGGAIAASSASAANSTAAAAVSRPSGPTASLTTKLDGTDMNLAEIIQGNRRRGKPMKALIEATERQQKQRALRMAAGGDPGAAAAGGVTEAEAKPIDNAEQLSQLAVASSGGAKPSLAPQLRFDAETGRIIIDEGSLTHVRQNPSNSLARGGAHGLLVNEGAR